MEVDQVRRKAQKYFSNAEPSHDWNHVKRVERLADRIAREEGADREIVKLAVLLHDIGRAAEVNDETDDHAIWGAREATEILADSGYPEKVVEQVRHCVKSHRYSNETEPETVEAEVVSDADNLDSLGTIGIARTFTVGGEIGQTIADLKKPVEEDDTERGETSLNHLQKKILKLNDRMYTGTGEEIAGERHQFVEEFVERMKKELRGEK